MTFLNKFRPDPYDEDLKFSELRYCFGGDGGGDGGGGDDGSSGDDYGSDGFAGDTDASIGGGYASVGDTGGQGYSVVDGVGVADVEGQYGYAPDGIGFSDADFDAIEAQFAALDNATGFTAMNAAGQIMDIAYDPSTQGFARISSTEANFLADVMNAPINVAPNNTGMFSSLMEDDAAVFNSKTGYLGEVVADNTLADAFANAINPVPFTMVDTARVRGVDGQISNFTSISTPLGDYSQMMTDQEAAAIQAAQAESDAAFPGGDGSYAKSVASASPYTPSIPTAPAAPIYPSQTPMMYTPSMYDSDPFGFFSYQDSYASPYMYMAEGGDVDQQMADIQQGTGDGPTGFVGDVPENLDDATKVADDVPMDVEDGSFVINAAAVEFAGSDDIKKMIVEAIEEARKQGLDISGDENKIDRENAVSLLVSRGEVVIPPILAKIIGYDKLNKINNRGKEETEERLAENGQEPEQPANPAEGVAMAAMGMDTRDTDVIDIYSSIQSQGGEPGQFETFRDAMDLYKGTKTYRPMEAEPGTPEFDAEVKDKYKLFFSDNPNPYMNKAERDAAKAKDKANMIDMSLPRAQVREDGTLYYIDRKTGKEVPAPEESIPGKETVEKVVTGFIEGPKKPLEDTIDASNRAYEATDKAPEKLLNFLTGSGYRTNEEILKMAGGGFAEAIEKYSTRDPQFILHDLQMTDDRQNVAGEIIGDGFAVKGRANRSQDARTTEYPDGVVVDEENKNLGFALNGELFLFDDTWLNAGIEKNRGSNKGTANIPTGDKVQFGDQFEMTRYNMGATFGDLSLDVSGMPGEGIDRGRVKYKLNKNRDELFIEGDESGNISAGLRLSI